MINWILGGLIVAAMFFAARYSLRKAHKGECVGCSGCGSMGENGHEGGGCCCCHTPQEEKTE